MSLELSEIITLIDDNVQTDSVKYPVASKVRDINVALDKVWSIILPAAGKWQLDDTNHADYPIITTNLVQGQRDYSFTSDEQGNLILDIYKVQIKDPSGIYRDLLPVDQQAQSTLPTDIPNIAAGIPPSTMTDGQETQGVPTCYDKTGNGIFLDLVPAYDSIDGLRIFINREASYFTVGDTTKKPGFAGIFHEYLALRPSYQYAYRKGLQNTVALQSEMLRMESEMKAYYGRRDKDTRKRLSPRIEWDR